MMNNKQKLLVVGSSNCGRSPLTQYTGAFEQVQKIIPDPQPRINLDCNPKSNSWASKMFGKLPENQKCAVKSIVSEENCPGLGIYKISREKFLCNKCYVNYVGVDKTNTGVGHTNLFVDECARIFTEEFLKSR